MPRSTWKELHFECCTDCPLALEAAWASHHTLFPGKRLEPQEPGVIMTNLSLRDLWLIKRNSFLRHRLPEPLTGYDPDLVPPWDQEGGA